MDRKELAAVYISEIGYDPFIDSPTITEEEVRQTLKEFFEDVEANLASPSWISFKEQLSSKNAKS